MPTVAGDPRHPERPRQRWEDEIEEILTSADFEPTPIDKARQRMTPPRLDLGRPRIAPERWMLGYGRGAWLLLVLLLAMTAFAFQHVLPAAGRMLAIAALIILAIYLFRSYSSGGSIGGGPSGWRRPGLDDSNPSERAWRSRLHDRDR